jgi:hypothetical protein
VLKTLNFALNVAVNPAQFSLPAATFCDTKYGPHGALHDLCARFCSPHFTCFLVEYRAAHILNKVVFYFSRII